MSYFRRLRSLTNTDGLIPKTYDGYQARGVLAKSSGTVSPGSINYDVLNGMTRLITAHGGAVRSSTVEYPPIDFADSAVSGNWTLNYLTTLPNRLTLGVGSSWSGAANLCTNPKTWCEYLTAAGI